MKYPIILILSLFAMFPLFAQTESTGFIVVKSDTIRGVFKTKDFDGIFSSIEFKKNNTDQWANYRSDDLDAFSVLGLVFESRRVTLDFSSRRVSNITANVHQNQVSDTTIFLSVEFDTRLVRLLKHVDQSNQDHYFIQKASNSKPEELIQSCKEVKGSILCTKKYLTTLRFYLNDCSQITDFEIKKTVFSGSDFKKILKKYVLCKGSVADLKVETRKKGRTVLSAYLAPGVIGVNFFGTVTTPNDRIEGLANAKFNSALSYQGGMNMDYIFGSNPHVVLSADAGVKYFSAKGSGTTVVPAFSGGPTYKTVYQDYSMDVLMIRISPSLKYKFYGTWEPYLRAGFVFNVVGSFSSTYNITEVFALVPGSTSSSGEALKDGEYKKLEVGYVGGFGVKKEKISLEGRFEYGSGLAGSVAVTSATSTISLFVGYQLSRDK